MQACRTIAEVGVNHMGSPELARYYVERLLATEIGAITFQIREDAFYDGSVAWRTKLSMEAHHEVRALAKQSGCSFGLSVGDLVTARQAAELTPDFWKVLSFAANDDALLEFLVATGVPVYVSTGISSNQDLVALVGRFPTLLLIHTQLSPDAGKVNLKAIETLAAETGVPVAYGLHSPDWRILFMAMCFQPEALFFYVKDDEPRGYADDAHAVSLAALPALIEDLRVLHTTIGTGAKHRPTP